MTTHALATSNPPLARRGHAAALRGDIQGLRAIAVASVVLYHLWPNRIPGGFVGVDMFFVISGFLITSHLLKAPPRRPADVFRFWARRLRRLLPASLLVLLVVSVASRFYLPSSMWVDTARQVVASAFYVQNWELANSAVDYLAADNAPSPVQHFWSLSVEEQFYFVWPVLIGVLALLGRRWAGERRAIAWGMIAVVVLSFAVSVGMTATEPGVAYFATPTRMWELGLGGLGALLLPWVVERGASVRALMAWLGLMGMAASFVLISGSTPFPGAAAALPVLSTFLVLISAAQGSASPAGVLGWRPLRFLGDISYSVYLWHWPLIVLAPALTGSLGALDKLFIALTSLVLGWLSFRFVEPVFRNRAWWQGTGRTFITSGLAMVLVAGAGTWLAVAATAQKDKSTQSLAQALKDPGICVGAEALPAEAPGCDEPDTLLLDPAAAKTDKSDAYPDGCWAVGDFSKRPVCTYGSGKTRVALVGNSHAGQWLPALQELAEQRDWTISTFLIDRCSPTTQETLAFDTPAKSQGCKEYASYVQKQTVSGNFDAVIVSQRQSLEVEGKTWAQTEIAMEEASRPILKAWESAALPVLLIRDVPYPGAATTHVPNCVAANESKPESCNGTPRSWFWMDPMATAASDYGNVRVVDPEPWICPDGQCRAVIGGVITYFDTSHITATYARSLAPLLGRAIDGGGLKGL